MSLVNCQAPRPEIELCKAFLELNKKRGTCVLKYCRWYSFQIDDYAKDGGPGEVRVLCSFCHDPLQP